MKVLVTGGAGYIGSFMVRHLKESGFEVVIADNLSSGHEDAVEGFNLQKIDLVYEKDKLDVLFAKENFDGVIHMASYIQMGESFRNPGKYFHNNLIAAINLLDCMNRFKVKNIILSSSAGVYGNPAKLPIEEDDFKNPLNPYGETKLMIEKMLFWHEKAHGLKFASIRYFNAAGGALDGSIGEDHPEESHLIPTIIKSALKGEEFTMFGDDYKTPDGSCVRDYIHVLDLVANHALALKALLEGAPSNFYNAGIGKGYSNKEVIDMVEKVTGLKVKVKVGPRREGDADALYASNEKIKKDLNWEPKYGLKEIVESAYLWHKNHPEGYQK